MATKNVGEMHGNYFLKIVSKKNLFRKFGGYGVDRNAVQQMRKTQKILLQEKGKDGQTYLTTAKDILEKGYEVEYGDYGKQIVLPTYMWQVVDKSLVQDAFKGL